MATMQVDVDVLVIGAGPCGLLASIGLQQKGLRLCIVDKFEKQSQDWSRSYAYRIDQRGLALLDVVGVRAEVERVAHEHSEFSLEMWRQDGTIKHNSGFSVGSTGYFLQRPALLDILDSKLDSSELRVRGTVQGIDLEQSGESTVVLKLEDGKTINVKAALVLGCDGIHSVVRKALMKVEPAFGLHKVDSPSAGLVFKATLITPPEAYDPAKIYVIQGKRSENSVSMLPFVCKPGETRMVMAAKNKDWHLFNIRDSKALLDALDAEFPQTDIRQRMTEASAKAWCNSEGSTFPVPQWAGKAACTVGRMGFALIGDSLHSFPPDLGQGVNSGLVDTRVLLECLPLHASGGLDATRLPKVLEDWGRTRVAEAEAICRLIPVGMPYQYSLPNTLQKLFFFAGFLTRFLLSKVMPMVFFPPAVVQIQEAPPLTYSKILENHNTNSSRLSTLGFVLVSALAGLIYYMNSS